MPTIQIDAVRPREAFFETTGAVVAPIVEKHLMRALK
jgi:hypothetical protein